MKKETGKTLGPHDLAKDLWAYLSNGNVELWTKHGCVGLLNESAAKKFAAKVLSLSKRASGRSHP